MPVKPLAKKDKKINDVGDKELYFIQCWAFRYGDTVKL